VHPVAAAIIRRHMSKTLNPNAYLFPLINDGMAYHSIISKIKRFTQENNKVTKAISEKLGIQVPVKSYTARHTAADALWSNGATDPQVMELLDHRDPRTTQKYKHNMRNEAQQKLIMGL
jgi:integrase